MVVVEPVKGITYYLDKRLKRNLDEKVIPALHKKDKDYVMVIDGNEGSGKSTFAFQIGKYIDSSLNLSRICFSPDEFREAIYKAKKGECVIYDEAFTGLASSGALTKINRMLVSLMMQMRQKNLLVIIVLPTIFMLQKYVAIFRTKILLHTYEVNGHRGCFKCYNEKKKKKLYYQGKKLFSYKLYTNFKGRFYGVFALGKDKEDKYKEKKAKALEESEKEQSEFTKDKMLRDKLIIEWHSQNLDYAGIKDKLKDYGYALSEDRIYRIITKNKKKQGK